MTASVQEAEVAEPLGQFAPTSLKLPVARVF